MSFTSLGLSAPLLEGIRDLGFSETRLRQLLREAGLTDVRTSVGARKAGDPFTVLLAVGQKPPRNTQRRRKDS